MANFLGPPRDSTEPLLVAFFAMPARLRTDEQPAASALITRVRNSLRASFVLRARGNTANTTKQFCNFYRNDLCRAALFVVLH